VYLSVKDRRIIFRIFFHDTVNSKGWAKEILETVFEEGTIAEKNYTLAA
jgi:hypothetical protein